MERGTRRGAGGRLTGTALLGLVLGLGCGDDAGDGGAGGDSPDDDGVLATVTTNAADASVWLLSDDAAVQLGAVDARVESPWLDCDSIDEGSDGGIEPYADPCRIDEDHGVFVDPEGGDDALADGSRDRPHATLAAAVARAVQQGKWVYACAGVYRERLRIGTELSEGLRVYGGLSCATFLPEDGARSVVRAEGQGAALVIADTRDVRVARFEIENVPATSPKAGTSYMGGFIENATGVRLSDVVLRAAPGEHGADGDAPPEPAPAGRDGLPGADACSQSPNPGPIPVTSLGCPVRVTSGGQGGDGGLGGGDGGNGTWLGFTNGGIGEAGSGWSCEAGVGAAADQAAGFDGSAGAGARGFGALLGGRFTGFAGQPGFAGGNGRGGGGGGGARAPASCAGLATPSGGAGGGGGSGGCGGAGGDGGRPGGSSLALVVMNAGVRMTGGALEYGDGGDGGHGAMGQLGGKGGEGGAGGQGSGGSSDACPGAAAGDGGRGGPGGGGAGGHAIGVLHVGDPPRLVAVEGEAQADGRSGGQGGQGPAEAGIDPMLRPEILGSEGVAAFMRRL